MMILIILLILFAAAGVFVTKRFAPSKTYADLDSYFNLTAYEANNRQAADSNELAIVLDDKILDNQDTQYFRGYSYDGETFVSSSLIQSTIDERFYADENEGVVIFTNAVDSLIASVDSSYYTSMGTEQDAGYIIATYVNNEIYFNIKFVEEHSKATFKVCSDPARIYIKTNADAYQYCTAKYDATIRISDSKQSKIVAVVNKGDTMEVLETEDGWTKVVDENGYIGYVQNNYLGEVAQGEAAADIEEPEYTHILLDDKVSIAWHGIYYYDSNYNIADATASMKGVNVLAPTWFMFADEYGTLISYCNQEYVDYAHENGWQVWAVLEDIDGESSVNIVPYTSKRQLVVDTLISECLAYGIDGLNIDIELVTSSEGDDFIQFIRELSVACRENGLILSVDDYAPYSYNAYRHTEEQSRIADYVAIMAYDDYVGTSEAGPNAGLEFVQEVVELSQEVIDPDRLIIGLPFYSRIWYEHTDGTLGRETYDMYDVASIIEENELTTQWLSDVGYDYASYENDENTLIRIWSENANSFEAKLELLSKYEIAGIATWRLGQETSDVWEVIDKYY